MCSIITKTFFLMSKFSVFCISAGLATLNLACFGGGGSSPSGGRLPAYNQPINGGSSTLVQKCREIARAQDNFDMATVMELSFLIGLEHDTPWDTDIDEDCASVGVNTYL